MVFFDEQNVLNVNIVLFINLYFLVDALCFLFRIYLIPESHEGTVLCYILKALLFYLSELYVQSI